MIWSDNGLLKSIPNPSDAGYEIKINTEELTFLGVKEQPDYGKLLVVFYPKSKVIELRAFKLYLQQFRTKVISYERLVNVIYDDLMKVYDPARLRLVLELNPRGGISSKLTIDSDWSCRGGKEVFKDWIESETTF